MDDITEQAVRCSPVFGALTSSLLSSIAAVATGEGRPCVSGGRYATWNPHGCLLLFRHPLSLSLSLSFPHQRIIGGVLSSSPSLSASPCASLLHSPPRQAPYLSLSLTCLLALSLTRTLSYQRIVHCLASPYNTPANSPSLLS